MWIFYSCPNDIKQQLAAIELNARNWRWHKRQQVWLTKDDMMMPQVLSMNHERGYYIVWDISTWRKERVSFFFFCFVSFRFVSFLLSFLSRCQVLLLLSPHGH